MKNYPLPKIYVIVKGYCKIGNTTLNKLSVKMGYHRTFLSERLKNNDIKVSLLLALSEELGINLFEHYENLLPLGLQNTARELGLKRMITQLQEELFRVKAERDKYWEALSK